MEWYTSTHSETVEEIFLWPWKRFERFYESAQKRTVIESLERRRDGMIAALWSNPNLDDEKGTRHEAIEDIERKCEEAIDIILSGRSAVEEDIPENEFFGAVKRGQAKIISPRNDEGTVREVIDYSSEIDQQ